VIHRGKLAFLVGAVAAFLPGVGGAMGGTDMLGVPPGGWHYALVFWGTVFSCVLGGLGNASLMGYFDDE
jgi:hypothetical protein